MSRLPKTDEAGVPPAPRLRDHLGLLLLAGMWGGAFLFIAEALAGFAPLQLAAGRILIAAVLLAAIAALRGERGPASRTSRRRLMLAGWSGASAPFALIAWGQQYVTSAEAAILMSFTPLATAILAHLFLRDEPLGRGMLAGILVGMAGVALLVGGPDAASIDDATPRSLRSAAALAILAGAFGYAASGILLRRTSDGAPIANAAWMMGAAAAVSVPLALFVEGVPASPVPPASLVAIAVLGLFPSGFAAVVLVWLIRRNGVNYVALNNFLVPLVGTGLGVLVLGERIGADRIAGLALILLGVLLAERARRRSNRGNGSQPRPR